MGLAAGYLEPGKWPPELSQSSSQLTGEDASSGKARGAGTGTVARDH